MTHALGAQMTQIDGGRSWLARLDDGRRGVGDDPGAAVNAAIRQITPAADAQPKEAPCPASLP